jgi:hypothetical protein
MNECNPVRTPIGLENLQIIKKVEFNGEAPKKSYRQAVRALMYLCCGTRPDIAFTISYVSRFLDCYTSDHWDMVKRIMRYLRETTDYKIKYIKQSENQRLTIYSDADFAGEG